MKKKATLIASLLILAQLAACGETTVDPTVTTAGSGDSTEAPAETRASSLPEGLNFGGKEIKILYWLEQGECTDEQNGEVVNDALYDRDRTVEDRLGVKLANLPRSYTWDSRMEYIDAIRQSVMAGDDSFDLVSGQYATMPTLIPDGVLLALNDTKYIDFSNPWWARGLVEETAINGKVYLASGEISISNIKELSCFFYNKRLADEYSIEDPYKLVESGEWTLDKLFELSGNVYSDLDNDGKKSIGDLYGISFSTDNNFPPLVTGAGIQNTTQTKDGYPELTLGSEKMIDVMSKITKFVHSSEGSLSSVDITVDNGDAVKGAFANGLTLFASGLISDAATKYNDMKDDFGVLPVPKYDKNQDSYLTLINEGNTLFGITASTKDIDAASATMEALCEENHYTVSPAYFEVALKVKYSRDDESAKMFDLIREGVAFDFGRLYSGATGVNLAVQIKDAITKDKSWSTVYAEQKDKVKAGIDSFIESVKNLD